MWNDQAKTAISEVRRDMLLRRRRDSWWLNIDGDTVERPMTLRSVEEAIRSNPGAEYLLLNVEQTDDDDPAWVAVAHEAAPDREASLPRRSRSPFQWDHGAGPPELDGFPPSPILAKLSERIEALEQNQRATLEALKGLTEIVNGVSGRLMALDSVTEREKFVEDAEERLVRETHRLEAERAELDQLRQDLEPARLKVAG